MTPPHYDLRNYTVSRPLFLDELKKRVLIFDGAMGSNLQALNPTPADFAGHEGLNDFLTISKPSLVASVHEGFLKVGCDEITTCTFSANRVKLGEYGIGNQVREVNLAAARLARGLADKYSTPDQPRFVAGDMGPSGFLPSSDDPELGRLTPAELEDIYYEQACALIDGGVDILLFETSQDILETRSAILGAHRARLEKAPQLALIAQVTLDATGRMLLGTDIGSVISTFRRLPIDVLGINCSTGPREMRESVRTLCQLSPFPVSVLPNAGLPENRNGKAFYPLSAEEFSAAQAEFVSEFGTAIAGGCCGTTHEHLRQTVEKIGRRAPKKREIDKSNDASSMMKRLVLDQDPKPLIVGERINAQGSKKAKQMMMAEDFDGLLQLARAQADAGAHALDVCVAMTERSDEADFMARLVKKLSLGVDTPLMIDTTEPAVLEAALRQYPGRALVNSINLEGNGERLKAVCPVAHRYGAILVALTIDGEGMAKTRQRKLEIAQKIQQACEKDYGIPADDLAFDCLTFSLATGEAELADSAVETLEAIRLVKQQIPGARTILGLSNVSFGLSKAAREVLNSVFLYHALKAGLDMAILNPLDIKAYATIPEEERRLAEDLLFHKNADALSAFVKAFEGKTATAATTAADPTEGMTLAQKIHWKIVNRKPEGMEELLSEIVKEKPAVEVLNNVLLPAMKEVGEKFGSGELILPFVLQSAETMKRAVAYLEQFLDKSASVSKGTIVLATVLGDVHDIGKNLVKTILSNNGFVVHDLGKQVPVATIVAKAKEVKADAIGLSALLVSTSKQMPLCVQELSRQGLGFPVVVGGAAINQRYGQRISFVEGDKFYEPGVYYARDAFDGLSILNNLADPAVRKGFQNKQKQSAIEAKERNFSDPLPDAPGTIPAASSDVKPAPSFPKNPFHGTAVIQPVPLRELWPLLDLNSLYKLNWGVKGSHEEYQKLVKERFEPMRLKMQEEALSLGIFEPKVVYGYWWASSEGNVLHVYDEPEAKVPFESFNFPRQKVGRHLCLADYFKPMGSGEKDVVAFQLATVGQKAADHIEKLNKSDRYSEGLFWHGLAVQTAEALAQWTQKRILSEWNLPETRGKRYSPGFPACPEMSDQAKVFRLLNATKNLGVKLTDAFMMVPEQSTSAMVVHHPDAEYFNVR